MTTGSNYDHKCFVVSFKERKYLFGDLRTSASFKEIVNTLLGVWGNFGFQLPARSQKDFRVKMEWSVFNLFAKLGNKLRLTRNGFHRRVWTPQSSFVFRSYIESERCRHNFCVFFDGFVFPLKLNLQVCSCNLRRTFHPNDQVQPKFVLEFLLSFTLSSFCCWISFTKGKKNFGISCHCGQFFLEQ